MLHLRKLILFSTCMAMIFSFSCSKEIQKQSTQLDDPGSDNQEKMLLEYQKEGFISPDRYRVIIVVPAEERCDDLNEMRRKARQRAVLSLRKYLMSQDIPVTRNAQAYILNVVNNHGSLIRHQSSSSSRYCFFFDIKKDNLKYNLDHIEKQR